MEKDSVFFFLSKHLMRKPEWTVILRTCSVCAAKAWYILFLCAIEQFHHYHKHTHKSILNQSHVHRLASPWEHQMWMKLPVKIVPADTVRLFFLSSFQRCASSKVTMGLELVAGKSKSIERQTLCWFIVMSFKDTNNFKGPITQPKVYFKTNRQPIKCH